VSPVPTTALVDKRRAVWDAVAAHRAASIAWIAGKGPAPTDSAKTLAAAEGDAGFVTFQPPTLSAIRAVLPKSALLSFRPVNNGVEVLALTEAGSKVLTLPGHFQDEVSGLINALPSGDAKDVGDKVRSELLDPLLSELLLGLGRYLVVGEGPVDALPVAALPEQQDGQRYLMEIRSVGHYTTLDQLIPSNDIPGEFSSDILAFCTTQAEVDEFHRLFPNGVVLRDKDATVAAWREKASKAHFIHIGAFPASADGGYKLADGVLSLAEIGATPLSATAAFVWGDGGPSAVLRSAVLRKAGVAEVLGQGWGNSDKFNGHFLEYWWELESGKTPAGRSLSDARPRALQEEDAEVRRQPQVWGGYFVMGRF
jgi:hypothetical protein